MNKMTNTKLPKNPKILLAEPFQISENCPDFVLKKIAELARTEDCKFSPDGKKLAVAGYAKHSIVIFDVEVDLSGASAQITLSNYTELASNMFDHPHGLDFVDNETLAVGNRAGSVTVYAVPKPTPDQKPVETQPLITLKRAGFFHKIDSPGSLCVSNVTPDSFDLLVCNNYTNRITSHRVSRGKEYKSKRNRIILERRLKIPDGITLSANKSLFAVSNHGAHQVLIYRNHNKNTRKTKPIGALIGADFPHGIRFFGDDRYLLVADAGLPFSRLYHSPNGEWTGDHHPIRTIRIMSDETFLKGHFYHQEGGLKGLDFNSDERILVTTCEMQPLVFYDAARLFPEANIVTSSS